MRRKAIRTNKGVSVTGAGGRTGEVAHQFIVVLRTLGHVVTQVIVVEADTGVPAAVEAWTRVAVAVRLVLATRTVVDIVAAHEDWQTVAVARTLEVGLRTRRVVQGQDEEVASAGELNQGRRR